MFWSYSNSELSASGSSLVGGESGEWDGLGWRHSAKPLDRLVSVTAAIVQAISAGEVAWWLSQHVSTFSPQRKIKIYFWNIQTNMHQDPISWNDPDDTRQALYAVCSVCCCMMVVVGGQQAAGHWAVIMERCNFRRVIIITAGCPRFSCKRTFARFEVGPSPGWKCLIALSQLRIY